MKVLTAHNTNAPMPDFCWCIEGELTAPAPTSPKQCTTLDCGCDRAHIGLNSQKATTTVMVRDLDMYFADVVTACRGYLNNTGWGEDAAEWMAEAMLSIAAEYEDGTVLRPNFDRDRDEWDYEVVR